MHARTKRNDFPVGLTPPTSESVAPINANCPSHNSQGEQAPQLQTNRFRGSQVVVDLALERPQKLVQQSEGEE